MRNLTLIFIFLFTAITAVSQKHNIAISGKVLSEGGSPLTGAVVHIQHTTHGTHADIDGNYTLKHVKPGTHTLVASFMGYKSLSKSVEIREDSKNIELNFTLVEDVGQIGEVTVKGTGKSAQLEQSGFAVTSIDTRDLQVKSLEINELLDRAPGLRVRRDGGLGSRTRYNINGLSGRAVRIFIDGVPAESFGSSYSVNSIPVSLIDRIDVYKGVVPIEFGNDAMGGAINIVTKQFNSSKDKNSKSLNASYSYGSFNTHRADLTGSWHNAKTGLTARVAAFYNYSDNNYKVWSDDISITDYEEFLPDGSRNPDYMAVVARGVKVRRFNDAYKSYGAKADFGIIDKNWTDQFFISLNMSSDYKESQHGPRMITPYGERFSKGWTVAPSISYLKNNVIFDGLNLSASFQYSQSQRTTVDTTTNRYDWYGNLIPEIAGVARLPGESGTASLNTDDNENYVGRVALSYDFDEHHRIGANYSNNQFVRSSDDELREAEERNYGSKNTIIKQIAGITYQNLFFDERLRNSVFAKYYHNNIKQDKVEYSNGTLDTTNFSRPDGNWGYGATSSFALSPRVRFNASIEQAVRLVTTNEVFGNVSDEIVESTDLQPEKSLNVNLGGIFTLYENGKHEVKLNSNLFFRNTYDRIRRSIVVRNDDSYSVFNNIGHVVSKGIEAQLDYNIGSTWHFMLQGYYLDSRFMEEYTENGSLNLNYKSREPNMPWLTSNAGVEYNKENLFKQGDQLRLSWFAAYIHEFQFDWDVIGNQNKPIIPTQLVNDVSISYTFRSGKITLSLDGKNIFNELAFDNYAVQKPGRAFYAKIFYRIFQ